MPLGETSMHCQEFPTWWILLKKQGYKVLFCLKIHLSRYMREKSKLVVRPTQMYTKHKDSVIENSYRRMILDKTHSNNIITPII